MPDNWPNRSEVTGCPGWHFHAIEHQWNGDQWTTTVVVAHDSPGNPTIRFIEGGKLDNDEATFAAQGRISRAIRDGGEFARLRPPAPSA